MDDVEQKQNLFFVHIVHNYFKNLVVDLDTFTSIYKKRQMVYNTPMKEECSDKPDWAPHGDHDAFAVRVRQGIEGHSIVRTASPLFPKKRIHLSVDEYVAGVLKRDKTILGRAITLIESNSPSHYQMAREVLQRLLPHTGGSLRIGITGVPGAGKSTLIETFGCYLVEQGHHVAVLAVDPSSTVSGGSILGDKTRMEKLSRLPECFIRPSPSSGTLGGVTRKSRETLLVCEAAGFDVILIETVGVGQSEITVRSMVDFFLLLMIAGAGDELQGIKKGVIELADALLVNKADGQNKMRADLARNEYDTALKYLSPATQGWKTQAFTCSALTGEGIAQIWNLIKEFQTLTMATSVFQERRNQQSLSWVFSMIEEYLKESFYGDANVKKELAELKPQVLGGTCLPVAATEKLLNAYFLNKN